MDLSEQKKNARPPKGAFCEEASPLSRETYIPCGQPADAIVKCEREGPYNMCAACADHNVRRRGAHYLKED